MLRGIVIPTDWNRVNAVFQVFCEIGEINPVADRWEYSYDSEENNREYLRRLWDAALEEESNPSLIPRPTTPHPESTLDRVEIRQRSMGDRHAKLRLQ